MLYHFEEFTQKYNDLLASTKKRFPSLEHDGDAELATLKVRLVFAVYMCVS